MQMTSYCYSFSPQSLNLDDESMEVDEIEGRVEVPTNWGSSIPPGLLNSINTCLHEITRVYQFADQLLAHPHRYPDHTHTSIVIGTHLSHPHTLSQKAVCFIYDVT